ncbi:DUF6542 domain-containing protein [Streptomyces sp. TP-A0874]|uniref:DUF6542 domain-containing protein n=1 Tax=Streptomyces sp. TP-A0874 TaxID=549819 RepID=UPI0008534D1F|nr:DUF6542 domain-containing protein [Streptomyces sp. TP-A0874]
MEQPSTPISRLAQRSVRRTAPLPRPTRGGSEDAGRTPDLSPEALQELTASCEASAIYRARRRRVAAAQPTAPPPRLHWLRQMPGPRFTGFGCGVLASMAMLLAAAVDRFLLDGSTVGYGVVFLLASVGCALWVRCTELIAAPVAAPIAYTVGLLALTGGTGLGGRLMNLFTGLAVSAGWLYVGTLLAGFVVGVRKLLLLADRAGRRRRSS